MDIRKTIVEQFTEVLALTSGSQCRELSDETVLLESGLNSLEFAILVTRLEEIFGRDPFTIMDEPVYPRTFKEFVDIYERHVR